MTKNYNYLNVNFFAKELNISHYLLAIVLITLPLNNIYISIATMLFVLAALLLNKRSITFQKANYWPIAYFLFMALSLLWSQDFDRSLSGLQKQLSMLFIPLAFFFVPIVTKKTVHNIIRVYSFGMVFFGLYFLINACVRYLQINNTAFFFRNELVPDDPGAIYISVFASLAIFHFIQIKLKSNIDLACIFVLTLLIFLLSSKSIITIDFIIVICYYAFFAPIASNRKVLTIFSVSLFVLASVFFVKEVRQRFLTEYQTAFIDNTLNDRSIREKESCIISVNEAWNRKIFHQDDFFPGTALRIYHLRIFSEMITQEPYILFNGFGLAASQNYINSKVKEHNLNPVYANYNFHNQYVQTLAELGVFGFLILVAMLYINLKNALNAKDFLHISFAITMLMLFLSESFFCRQRGIVFFIVLFCLFNATSTKLSKK